MQRQFSRDFYMVDQNAILKQVYDDCAVPCQATKIISKEKMIYKSTTKPTAISSHFGADVLVEQSKKILIVREVLSSITASRIIKDETAQTLSDNIRGMVVPLMLGKQATVRVDAQASLVSIMKHHTLLPDGIILEVGQVKNVNKNGMIDKACRELRDQLIRIGPSGQSK